MTSATMPLVPHLNPTRFALGNQHVLNKQLILSPPLCPSRRVSLMQPSLRRKACTVSSAYVTGPASDPSVSDPEPNIEESTPERQSAHLASLISWRLLGGLLAKHKMRLGVSVLALFGCTTCTLSMPIFSGRFFEVLIGARPDPLWRLLGKVALLYSLEPLFTVIFVVNVIIVWEGVMSRLRALIFRRVLIQKVEFYDRFKVGELTGLLTYDLGSVKDIVSENVSRDRGFRAFSEVIGTICILFSLAPQLAPILGLLMLTVSIFVAVYKRSTIPVFKAHGLAQASISDCVTETFSAIRTVRSFGGEMCQMLIFGKRVRRYWVFCHFNNWEVQ